MFRTAAPMVFAVVVSPVLGLLVGSIEHRRDWWGAGGLTLLLIGQGLVDFAFPLVESFNENQAAKNAYRWCFAIAAFLAGVAAAKLAAAVLAAQARRSASISPN